MSTHLHHEPSEYAEGNLAQIRDTIARLQSPIQDVQTLLSLLAAPLRRLRLLSPQFLSYDTSPLDTNLPNVLRYIPVLQRALLEHVIPSWETILKENRTYGLIEQYFFPDSFSFASPAAGEVALQAYSVILSLPLTDYSIAFLARLAKAYPIDVLHKAVFSGTPRIAPVRGSITWEDCVRNVAAVPGKVANALGVRGVPVPAELEHGVYFNHTHSREDVTSVAYLISKLVSVGVFPPSIPSSPAQPSFFQAALPGIRAHVASPRYTQVWAELLSELPSSLALNTILTSFVSHLRSIDDLDTSDRTRAVVHSQALLLRGVFGKPGKDRGELWDAIKAVALGREWSVGHARVFACWISGVEKGRVDVTALETFLKHIVTLWTTPEHVKHSLLKHHQYVTALLLLVLSYLPASPTNPGAVNDLALSPPFVNAVSIYLGHLDPSVRRCGMLVAEEVARGAGKKLDFDDWDGDQPGKAWSRDIRQLVRGGVDSAVDMEVDSDDEGDGDEEANPEQETSHADNERETTRSARQPRVETVEDSDDDSLSGYASSNASSRSPSPTPSELEEIEKDPTLRVGQKKVARPVYLAQLGEMVRPTSGVKSENEEGEVTKIEVALNAAEELIRRKSNYGTELEENAVNLVYGFVGLQDNYDLENFSQKRQATLNALVACCPRKAVPAMIEEFFQNQYSTEQRFAMLNALALGARELAGLPVPETPATQNEALQRVSFPSKRLPPHLHQKYVTASDASTALQPVQNLLEGISRTAIDKTRDDAANKVPGLVRQKQLRIRQPAKVTELRPATGSVLDMHSAQMKARATTTFTDVAAEYFIYPLINRFWLFLRDEQTRETRTAGQSELHRYKSTGTGLILNAMVLSHFLATLAVLVHASKNAKEWLAVVAPDALELAVALGTRRLTRDEDTGDDGEGDGKGGKEAAVLTNSLELVLVVLDGCVDRDGGRTISLEHTTVVLGAGDWAGEVLSQLEKGAKVLGGGGAQEVRLRRAAAGVVLKVDEVTSRWRRSMIEGF
ncbi:telomere binding protein [Steccherinum ochraceum]|uniref:Telomere binding protein n=1 Tax=Steccherinum ochraceum TaxID=92696 RepID=A0A4R0RRN3_9APHY|nr:telomere binding protein [Steccherinum ochraceum]